MVILRGTPLRGRGGYGDVGQSACDSHHRQRVDFGSETSNPLLPHVCSHGLPVLSREIETAKI
jgi:hypothetical protein